jgi:hypothetical protein
VVVVDALVDERGHGELGRAAGQLAAARPNLAKRPPRVSGPGTVGGTLGIFGSAHGMHGSPPFPQPRLKRPHASRPRPANTPSLLPSSAAVNSLPPMPMPHHALMNARAAFGAARAAASPIAGAARSKAWPSLSPRCMAPISRRSWCSNGRSVRRTSAKPRSNFWEVVRSLRPAILSRRWPSASICGAAWLMPRSRRVNSRSVSGCTPCRPAPRGCRTRPSGLSSGVACAAADPRTPC